MLKFSKLCQQHIIMQITKSSELKWNTRLNTKEVTLSTDNSIKTIQANSFPVSLKGRLSTALLITSYIYVNSSPFHRSYYICAFYSTYKQHKQYPSFCFTSIFSFISDWNNFVWVSYSTDHPCNSVNRFFMIFVPYFNMYLKNSILVKQKFAYV